MLRTKRQDYRHHVTLSFDCLTLRLRLGFYMQQNLFPFTFNLVTPAWLLLSCGTEEIWIGDYIVLCLGLLWERLGKGACGELLDYCCLTNPSFLFNPLLHLIGLYKDNFIYILLYTFFMINNFSIVYFQHENWAHGNLAGCTKTFYFGNAAILYKFSANVTPIQDSVTMKVSFCYAGSISE